MVIKFSGTVAERCWKTASVTTLAASIFWIVIFPQVTIIRPADGGHLIPPLAIVIALPTMLLIPIICAVRRTLIPFFAAITLGFLALLGLFAYELLNVELDQAPPQLAEYVLISKHTVVPKSRVSHIFVFRPDVDMPPFKVEVPSSLYKEKSPGQSFYMRVGKGYFGMPWVKDFAV